MKFNLSYNITDHYLNKNSLKDFLFDFIHDTEIAMNKKVPNSIINNRPDFRIEELKTIIEFNGKSHYTNPQTIISDFKKRRIYSSMGYRVFEIPYWIQLDRKVINFIFQTEVERDFTSYPHGFISKDCPLPCDYCDLGNKRFLNEMFLWYTVLGEKESLKIKQSLIKKIFEKDSFYKVANQTVLPYFKSNFYNMDNIYGIFFNSSKYKGIEIELDTFWEY